MSVTPVTSSFLRLTSFFASASRCSFGRSTIEVTAERQEYEEEKERVPRIHLVLRRHHTVRPRNNSSSGSTSTER